MPEVTIDPFSPDSKKVPDATEFAKTEFAKNHMRNIEAMKRAQEIAASLPKEEQVKEDNDFFRANTLEELIADFFMRRFPRIFMFFWGQKIIDIAEAFVEESDFEESNKIIKIYLKERNRLAMNQQRGSIESVSKIKVPVGAGCTRFVATNR